jgi:hypothetical protein
MCVEHIPHSDFLGEVWVNERGLAGAASANPSSFMVPGARFGRPANKIRKPRRKPSCLRTGRKQRTPADENRGHLQKGQSGNPGGWPKGSRTFAIRELIAEALEDPATREAAIQEFRRALSRSSPPG